MAQWTIVVHAVCKAVVRLVSTMVRPMAAIIMDNVIAMDSTTVAAAVDVVDTVARQTTTATTHEAVAITVVAITTATTIAVVTAAMDPDARSRAKEDRDINSSRITTTINSRLRVPTTKSKPSKLRPLKNAEPNDDDFFHDNSKMMIQITTSQ